MASAVALMQAMAGHAPAIRVSTSVIICLWAVGFTFNLSPAAAQMDQLTRGKMQYLYRSLAIAEENLSLAIRDKDNPRAKLVNDLLFNLASVAHERKLAANPCLEALKGLEGVAVAVVFIVLPTTTGDLGSMTREDLRFSKQMRPTDSTLEKWFGEYSATYRTKMADCEQEIGAVTTSRSLPDKLPQK